MWTPEIGEEVRVQRLDQGGCYEVIGVVTWWGEPDSAGAAIAKVKIGRFTESVCKGIIKPLVPEETDEPNWDDRINLTPVGRALAAGDEWITQEIIGLEG